MRGGLGKTCEESHASPRGPAAGRKPGDFPYESRPPWAPPLTQPSPEGEGASIARQNRDENESLAIQTFHQPRLTLPGSCKAISRHRLEPWAYLRDVVLKLSAGGKDLESLLPDRWAASHPEHVLQHRPDESRRKATRQEEARQECRAIAGPKA